MDPTELRVALEATFGADATCELPPRLPAPPRSWEAQYRVMARDLGLSAATLDEGAAVAAALVDPVLLDLEQTDGE